jgi:hypothetical protein
MGFGWNGKRIENNLIGETGRRKRIADMNQTWKERLNERRKWIHLAVLSFGAFLFLGTEFGLLMSGKGSLCPTSSCRIAAESVRFGNKALVGLGAVYFLVLSVFSGCQKTDNPNWRSEILGTMILGGLAFDGAILGFQFFNISGRCPLCWFVALLLIASLGVYCRAVRSGQMLAAGLSIWIMAFAANGVMISHQKTPLLDEVAYYHFKSGDSEFPKYYLFFGIHCPHCLAVFKHLAREPVPGDWVLAAMDRDPEGMKDLSAVKKRLASSDTVFATLVAAKQDDHSSFTPIDPAVASAIQKARILFQNSGFKNVPCLIALEKENVRTQIMGEDAIIHYFQEKHH